MSDSTSRISAQAWEIWRDLMRLLQHDADGAQILSLHPRIGALADAPAIRDALVLGVKQALSVKDRSEQHQRRERGLIAVLESAQDLTAITDLDRVLRAIVQRARKLVGCDVGYLSIFDPGRGDFYVRATDGAFSSEFRQIRIGLEVGVCGYVARNKVPYASSDYGADSRFAHTSMIDAAMAEENIKSILGVPLFSGERVVGVLFVGDRYIRSYPAWEKSILSTLAAHASVAIGNAHLFEQEQAALRQASDTNRLLARQTADTQMAADAHEALTALAAKGGDLADICRMASTMLGGRVVAYDDGEQEVCSSGEQAAAAGGAAVPGRDGYWLADRIHAALTASRTRGRSVPAYEEQGRFCRVSAIMGGSGMLGGLAIYTDEPLREFEVRIFERTSMIAAVVLLSRERGDFADRMHMSAIVHGLVGLPQNPLSQCAVQAGRHGLDLSRPTRMVLVQMDAAQAAHVFRRLLAQRRLEATVFDLMDDCLVFVCDPAAVPALRRGVFDAATGQMRQTMVAVVSDCIGQADGLARAYAELAGCLRLLRALGRFGQFVEERELALYSLVFKPDGAGGLSSYLAAVLGRLYDGRDPRKAVLADTLLAYFDCGHNARRAAKSLGVHINTVHQRLDAIDALLGDWRGAARALDLHMALRLWRLADGARREAPMPPSRRGGASAVRGGHRYNSGVSPAARAGVFPATRNDSSAAGDGSSAAGDEPSPARSD